MRLAGLGATKSLHLPRVIEQGLTPETRKALNEARMDVVAIDQPLEHE
jgi:hypothetical protein